MLFTFSPFIRYTSEEDAGGEGVKVDAYDKLLLQWTKELTGYLVKMGAEKSDAEDMAQESLLALLVYEDDLPLDKLRPWLFRVGINRYFDLYRQKKRHREILLQDYVPLMTDTFSPKESPELDALKAAFSSLSYKEQTLLYMKYEENHSLEAMGFLLKRPSASIKTELYRTRKKLKKIMVKKLEKNRLEGGE